jgi:putative FmdB family regulatory protein
MPLYEYQCTQCGAIEEAIQKFSDAPLTTCSKCSGRLNKLISQSSFHLKGTGWYVTDYSKKASSKAASKQSDATPSPGKQTDSANSESKTSKSDE